MTALCSTTVKLFTILAFFFFYIYFVPPLKPLTGLLFLSVLHTGCWFRCTGRPQVTILICSHLLQDAIFPSHSFVHKLNYFLCFRELLSVFSNPNSAPRRPGWVVGWGWLARRVPPAVGRRWIRGRWPSLLGRRLRSGGGDSGPSSRFFCDGGSSIYLGVNGS